MSGTGVRREALREIAREKARMLGKKPYSPEDRKRESYQPQQEEKKPFPEERTFFEQISPDKINLAERRADDSSFSWTQFSPWRKEGKKRKRPKLLNTATIWCMANKIIAQEWRRARGIKKKDFGLDVLEREAAAWEERREAKRIKQQEAEARFRKHKEKLDEALRIIGQKMVEEKDNLTSKGAVRLIEDAMGSIGKVYNVEWGNNGCDIWIEPWEERWPRQKKGETLPVIYRLRINDNLEMVSYELIEDEKIRQEQKESILANQLEKSVDEGLLEDEQDIKVALEKRIDQIGRLLKLKEQEENVWIAIIEPWEEMRRKNIERKGQGPVVTEAILVRYANGTVTASPINKDG